MSGGKTATFRYDGDGKLVLMDVSNQVRRTSDVRRTLECDIGLYYYGARWYDHLIGRFAQADSIVPEPGNPQSLNRYSYALNNPVENTDPTGHWVESALDIAFIGYDLSIPSTPPTAAGCRPAN